jgi:ATP-dependent Clp protease ATP-binding subunit ClpA
VNNLFGPERLAVLVSWEISSSVARHFEVEAKRAGAKFIEAEHMLLGLVADPDSDAAKLLRKSGIDHGMSAPNKELVEATEPDLSLTFGTSAKTAIRRGLIASRHDRPRRPRLRSTDLLVGILQAELGTVARALAIAGVDRTALISSTTSSE